VIENRLRTSTVVCREFRPEGLVRAMEIPVLEVADDGAVGQT
jgi:hypothetical protein